MVSKEYGPYTAAIFLSGDLNLKLLKLRMLARWDSPIVTHDTRRSPLKGLGDDVKRAKILNDQRLAWRRHDEQMNEVHAAPRAHQEKYEKGLATLRAKITQMEAELNLSGVCKTA